MHTTATTAHTIHPKHDSHHSAPTPCTMQHHTKAVLTLQCQTSLALQSLSQRSGSAFVVNSCSKAAIQTIYHLAVASACRCLIGLFAVTPTCLCLAAYAVLVQMNDGWPMQRLVDAHLAVAFTMRVTWQLIE